MLPFRILLLWTFPVTSASAGRGLDPDLTGQCPLPTLFNTPIFLPSDEAPPSLESATTQQQPWIQASICHRAGKEKFCAYTNPSFNDGEGISIITTAARIARIALKPIFQNDAAAPQASGASSSYKDEEVPGKGVGLIATRPIRAGQRVMARTPAVVVDETALDGLHQDQVAYLLGSGVKALPQLHRERFLNLSTHDESVGRSRLDDRAYRIFAINRFRTGDISGDGVGFHAAFTEVSRLNHECRPNCVYYFDHASLSHKVFVARDIMPGEELTISYIDGFQSSPARQELLENHWGFRCSCPHCTAERHTVSESDDRIQQILRLWKELDDYSPTNTAATPEKAELLVLLYELEGMHGRLQEAYYRAAVEWNGVGQAEKAVKYARLCLHSGLVFKGPGKPFIEQMRELVADPRGHKTWEFRLNKSN